MKTSFYRNLIWIIGIFVAVEIIIQLGIAKALIPLVADLSVVLVLSWLFYRLNAGENHRINIQENQQKKEAMRKINQWQQQHDRWWKEREPHNQPDKVKNSTNHSSRDRDEQIKRVNLKLKQQNKYLKKEISALKSALVIQSKLGSDQENGFQSQQSLKLDQKVTRLDQKIRQLQLNMQKRQH